MCVTIIHRRIKQIAEFCFFLVGFCSLDFFRKGYANNIYPLIKWDGIIQVKKTTTTRCSEYSLPVSKHKSNDPQTISLYVWLLWQWQSLPTWNTHFHCLFVCSVDAWVSQADFVLILYKSIHFIQLSEQSCTLQQVLIKGSCSLIWIILLYHYHQ